MKRKGALPPPVDRVACDVDCCCEVPDEQDDHDRWEDHFGHMAPPFVLDIGSRPEGLGQPRGYLDSLVGTPSFSDTMVSASVVAPLVAASWTDSTLAASQTSSCFVSHAFAMRLMAFFWEMTAFFIMVCAPFSGIARLLVRHACVHVPNRPPRGACDRHTSEWTVLWPAPYS